MICPYICHVVQTNQNRYEYDDDGRNTFHEHVLVETKKPMDCARGDAGPGGMGNAPTEVERYADAEVSGGRTGGYGGTL